MVKVLGATLRYAHCTAMRKKYIAPVTSREGSLT